MENYILQQDEVMLFKCDATLPKRKAKIQLLLTNLYIVFVIKSKKLFSKDIIGVEQYPIEDVKIYKEQPQIKQEYASATIYFKNSVQEINFPSHSDTKKFVSQAWELITGKNKAIRGLEKTQKAVNVVDETLGVDTTGTVKGILQKGVIGSIFGGFGKKTDNKTGILDLAKEIETRDKSKKSPMEEQVEVIQKWKQLLDMGAITQEEFDQKKKEVLGL